MLARLGATLSSDATESTADLLYLLDRAIDRRIGDYDSVAGELSVMRGAVAAAPVALVVVDSGGREVCASDSAAGLLAGSVSAVLPRQVLQSVVQRAVYARASCHEAVDVFGPPSRTLTVTAIPVPNPPEPTSGVGAPYGNACPVVVLIEDTTEIRKAEMARRDMVTNISHELRTPVGAVALLAETLTNEKDPDTIRHLAGRLEIEAERLAATLHDVLSLSRLEAAGPADRSVLELGELVRVCCAKLQQSAHVVGIDLQVGRISADLQVTGDGSLLRRAIDNLLENAIKYSDKGQPVVVEAFASSRPDGEFATVTVKDSGIGIPLRDRQRIFERFYRVDRARSRDTGGSGLGLAIVRHVAVSHDGHVDVESLEGVGSTFTLRIPLANSRLHSHHPLTDQKAQPVRE
jgi:two-component system, OmpR family, sensor histidine kinase SenX3